MNKNTYLLLISLLLLVGCKDKPTRTILVSIDGFGENYKEMYNTPALDNMKEEGVNSIVIPSYPTTTYANHYSMATGLLPGRHGIIGDNFYDRKNNKFYSVDSLSRFDESFYNGEPIWNTAARQGKKVATILWPTSDVEINGALPYMYKSTLTDNGLTSEQRIDTALKWMAMDEALRPDLLMLFLEGPEQTIRKYGQDSEEAKKSIENADAMIARLREGIKKLPDSKRINLIVTSDHGMTKVDKECFFNINDYIKPEWYEKRVGNNPMHIFTKPQFTDSVYNSLRRVYKVYVWKKDGVPDDLKFFNETDNFGDILVTTEQGCHFGAEPKESLADNGYFQVYPDMQVPFLAVGPDFRKGYDSYSFYNIDIYPLMCKLLNIEEAPCTGWDKRIEDLLVTYKGEDISRKEPTETEQR